MSKLATRILGDYTDVLRGSSMRLTIVIPPECVENSTLFVLPVEQPCAANGSRLRFSTTDILDTYPRGQSCWMSAFTP
jgi:hypothetical protein